MRCIIRLATERCVQFLVSDGFGKCAVYIYRSAVEPGVIGFQVAAARREVAIVGKLNADGGFILCIAGIGVADAFADMARPVPGGKQLVDGAVGSDHESRGYMVILARK